MGLKSCLGMRSVFKIRRACGINEKRKKLPEPHTALPRTRSSASSAKLDIPHWRSLCPLVRMSVRKCTLTIRCVDFSFRLNAHHGIDCQLVLSFDPPSGEHRISHRASIAGMHGVCVPAHRLRLRLASLREPLFPIRSTAGPHDSTGEQVGQYLGLARPRRNELCHKMQLPCVSNKTFRSQMNTRYD